MNNFRKVEIILIIIVILLTSCNQQNKPIKPFGGQSNTTETKTSVSNQTAIISSQSVSNSTVSNSGNTSIVSAQSPSVSSAKEDTNSQKIIVNESSTIDNVMGNIDIGGIAASDGTYEYYWFGWDDEWEGYMLRSKPDGSDKKIICKDRPEYINLVGDWIYYIKVTNFNGPTGQIYRIKKDGSGRNMLYSKECTEMKVVENKIYFINCADNRVCSINTDGTNLINYDIVSCSTISFINGYCLYTLVSENTNSSIYKTNNLSKEQANKIIDFNGMYMVYKNKIYYTNDDMLFCMELDGTNKTQIFNKKVFNFNISNDEIFCFVPDENRTEYEQYGNQIYKLSLEGKKIIRITNDENNNMRMAISCIVGDYIYYWADYGESMISIRKVKKDGSGDIELPKPN